MQGRVAILLTVCSILSACSHYHEPMPEEALAYFNAAQAYQMKGDLDSALIQFNKADVISPGHTAILNNRGMLRASLGDDAGAVDDLTRAINACKDQDQRAVLHGNRALVHLQFKRMDKACADWALAGRDGTSYREKHCH